MRERQRGTVSSKSRLQTVLSQQYSANLSQPFAGGRPEERREPLHGDEHDVLLLGAAGESPWPHVVRGVEGYMSKCTVQRGTNSSKGIVA